MAGWSSIDPTPFSQNWAIDALCDHLQAVKNGDIQRLLINFPPRCGKTNVASVIFPAWVWAQSEREFLSGPSVRFLCGSYNDDLSLQNSLKTRRLILSPWYQARWGGRFDIRDDQNTKTQFDLSEGGSRRAVSVRGTLLGVGGDIVVVDDPHNMEQAESEAERLSAMNWWKEISTTRLNDPKLTPIVVIMQRLHDGDVSGVITASEDYVASWTHLMIPAEHDPQRHCVTVLKWDEDGEPAETWEDPRTEPDELMWPERLGFRELTNARRQLGEYMYAGRYQQAPLPPGGGIFKRDWWQLYPLEGETFNPETGKPLTPLTYPAMDYIVASVDTAYTEKEHNDWSACTVWGVWRNEYGLNKAMLMDAWQVRLEFHALVEKMIRTATDMKVDRLLIEAKGNGLSVAQEIGRLMRGQPFAVNVVDPKGDKVARAYAVTNLFEVGMVYAPDRKWADMVMEEMASFRPGGSGHDDLVDSAVQALRYLRDTGMLSMRDEHDDDMLRRHSVRASQPAQLPYAV